LCTCNDVVSISDKIRADVDVDDVDDDDDDICTQLMSKSSDSAESTSKPSPFDHLECVAHNCPLLLRRGDLSYSRCISSFSIFNSL